MTDIRVTFPEPCSEEWDGMSPRGCDRHCASCDKIVYDLEFLTADETEVLLDSGKDICVRARIAHDGSVRTASGRSRSSRRIVTAIGASVTLATAACQTGGTASISPRYEIKGHVGNDWASSATLTSSDGKARSMKLYGDLDFRFSNLRPGTYTLSFMGTCHERHRIEIIVVKDDIDLGAVKFGEDNQDCIIIGRMDRESETRQA